MDFVGHMWLLKVSMQIESGPAPHLHFCEQDVTCSFYSVSWSEKKTRELIHDKVSVTSIIFGSFDASEVIE